MANWFCNEELGFSKSIALTFSSWHGGYDTLVRGNQKTIRNSRVAPYFNLLEMPWLEGKTGTSHYKFVGQGARALAYSRDWAEHILRQRVDSYFDCWLISQLTKERQQWEKKKPWAPWNTLSLLCDPPIFEHVPTFHKRFRGSGRLEKMAPNTATENSYYITVSFIREWGLCNRINTITVLGHICSMARFGMYILWEETVACPGKFDEGLIWDTTVPTFHKIPFVQVFDDRKNSQWMAAHNNQHWCKAHFDSQSSVKLGLEFFLDTLEDIAKSRQDKQMLQNVVPKLRREFAFEQVNMLVTTNSTIKAKAEEYIATARDTATMQVGVHLRRGDHKYLNCHEQAQRLEESEANELMKQWSAADDAFQEPAVNT